MSLDILISTMNVDIWYNPKYTYVDIEICIKNHQVRERPHSFNSYEEILVASKCKSNISLL